MEVYATLATVGLELITHESSSLQSSSSESDISQSECDIDFSLVKNQSCMNAKLHMMALPSLWVLTDDSAPSSSELISRGTLFP